MIQALTEKAQKVMSRIQILKVIQINLRINLKVLTKINLIITM